MSWIKRRGQATSPNPSSAPPVQMYNPNQHLQSQWQQQDLQAPPTNNWYNQAQPTHQQKSLTSNYSQPSQQSNYWQQPFNNQQTTPYNQNTNQYSQQYSGYNQTQAGYYENNSFQQQQQQQSYTGQQTTNNPTYNYENTANHVDQPAQSEADTWNWGWGDEDNSNVQSLPLGHSNTNQPTNAVTDSLAGDEAWNWSIEDANNTNLVANISNKSSTELHGKTSNLNLDSYTTQNVENKQDSIFPKMGKLAEKHNRSPDSLMQNLRENNDQKTNSTSGSYSENLSGNQVLGISPKHSKSDNLTPQWSTESQLSQDSSDLLHTSESDKSHMLSRSSTISESPISGHDANSDTFITNRQEALRNQQFESYNNQTGTEIPEKIEPNASSNYYKQDNYNLQHENREVLSNIKEDLIPFKSNSTPPPPMKNQTPPVLPPPTSGDDLRNPYKRTTGLSHKAAHKYKTENHQQGYFMPNQNYPISSSPFNQSVNLETLPDNSEQPDSLPQQNQPRKISSTKTPVQQWSENNEIAPINDRNQYLETGQLSNNDFVQSNHTNQIEASDTFPPPGFTRMVLGQMEHTDSNVGNQDEPPPGLSRKVLGQTESSASPRSDVNELPVGLHRIIPGESSSPEVFAVRDTNRAFQMPGYADGDVSESESNQPVASQVRSATIGADTPPVTSTMAIGTSTNVTANRSETIGADLLLPYSSTTASDNKKSNNQVSSASSSYNSNIRETNADGANKLDENVVTNPPAGNRRDSIEGQPQDTSSVISNLVNSVRDLTVGENTTDAANSTLSIPERSTRRSSRQESTDSEHEHENRGKISKDRKDRRFNEKPEQYEREKGRSSRYSPSPEQYRDKKHDRRRYRDKRYEEESDYFSDKERDKRRDDRDRREELDRKYSSLKKDKEKERKRREYRSHRDYVRDGRRSDYYGRYEEEYDDAPRSRPSSRSDSMQDSYRQDRDRHRDRERDRHRRHRDPFNPYLQSGYHYDPYSPYYQQYQYHYYENLRRTNPQAYAEWYRKYYQQSGIHQGYGNEDRASVHSGRSSANDELAKDRPFDQTDSSLYLDETTAASQRLTPAKFATAHIKASISSGHLVKIFPHYPLDGQTASVEVSNLHELLCNDEEYKELIEFPGPLVKTVTHKKTIIEYCENKIRNAICSRDIVDVDSYILMWELLILLLRQNGMVVGTDIAELLMKDRKQQNSRRASVVSNNSSIVAEPSDASNVPISETNSSSMSILKEEIITNKFREYLIYGSEKEALEWAMKHGLWGHALFLASKLDKRTYANVMTRFANGLPMNDPLQTLYQLLSGKVPSAVTSVADEKWGDWRPHLAMILSNTTQRPELDRKAITTLADTLLNRGSLYAAQFCYLMAQVGFSRYGAEGAKLVLLGSNHSKPFLEFAVNEAIHMTEVYEYACSLNDAAFLIPEFQPYKYLLATRLADRGLLEKALAYLEKVTLAILQNPTLAQPSLITQVCELADRLKYCDPVEDHLEGDGDLDTSCPDNSWLKDLKTLESDYSMGLVTHEATDNYSTQTPDVDPSQTAQSLYEQSNHESWQQQYIDQQYQQQWQSQYTDQQPQVDYQVNQQTQHQDVYGSEQYQEHQQPYWPNQQQWGETQQSSAGLDTTNQTQENVEQHSQTDYWNNAHIQDVPRPQITMPNQAKGHSAFNDEQNDTTATQIKKESPFKPKPKPQEKPATTGWFGGIWNKLSLRPKNQMKLPDDKNPTIVWDENKKQWVNLEAEADGTAPELKPPPKMSDMFPSKQPENMGQQPPSFNTQPQSFHSQSQSLNSQPQSFNSQPQNFNSQPHSFNSQSQTFNSQPQTFNSQSQTFNSQSQGFSNSQTPSSQPSSLQQDISHQSTNNNIPMSGGGGVNSDSSSMISNQNTAMQRTQQTVSNVNNNNNNEEPMVQPKSNQPNMFKLRRSRNIKKAYVDVFNPGAKTTINASTLPAPDAFGTANNGPQMNFFIPAPVNDPNAPTDFLTPVRLDDNQQPQMYPPQ